MDLNQLYFDRQMSLIRAEESPTSELRRKHESEAIRIHDRIRGVQRKLGAAAACALTMRLSSQAA